MRRRRLDLLLQHARRRGRRLPLPRPAQAAALRRQPGRYGDADLPSRDHHALRRAGSGARRGRHRSEHHAGLDRYRTSRRPDRRSRASPGGRLMEDEVPLLDEDGADFHAIRAKHTVVAESVELLVIGAGEAGLAAAIEAAKAGVQVMLIDENPLGAGLIGMDVPQLFGNRWTAAVQNQGRMTEQLLATNPGLEEAFELGVDVRLGPYAWGAFVAGPNLRALAGAA